jgi:hypothetical protein
MDLTFRLTVTNEEGMINEPDEMHMTVRPVSTSPPNEGPLTLEDLMRELIKNPLDITNSIDLSDKILDILTDNNSDNDQLVCEYLENIQNKQVYKMREIINC